MVVVCLTTKLLRWHHQVDNIDRIIESIKSNNPNASNEQKVFTSLVEPFYSYSGLNKGLIPGRATHKLTTKTYYTTQQ